MAFSLVLYVIIFLFSLLFISIAYKRRNHKFSVFEPRQSVRPPCSKPITTYDVFLSFRGEDTRNNFVGHLYKALDQYGIYTFKDDEKLKKGKVVAPELLKSIEESRLSIVILSENYASSGWCLDELFKIIECVDQFEQIVVPIFYDVDPSDVRKQAGSFKRAFDEHEKTLKKDIKKVIRWREALRRVGSIAGSDSRNKDESVLVQEIVRDISEKLFSGSSNDDSKLIGMNHHMEIMNSLLCNDGSNEVLMIGIWGMGGIGKTTISRALYGRYSRHYDGRCYMANVKDNFRKHDPNSLREKLLSEILQDRNLNVHTLNDNINVIKERLSRKKVFIVLDDVDHLDQLETFADKHDWFGPGSRIIITTRDQHLLNTHGVNYIYHTKGMRTHNEAFQLFSQYAFKQDKPTSDYLELSDQIVSYANRLPSALKILGSFLHNKSIIEWRNELDKLKKIPNASIQDVHRKSYNGLVDKQKDIFLDIACFFKGEEKEFVTNIMESCGFFPNSGLRALVEKSLITISYNRMLMHDSVQEMGWEVVRDESMREPGKRSRLWLPEDICHVFKHNTGTIAVEGIFLDISKIDVLQLTCKAFKKMHNLRLLKIYSTDRNLKENIKVHLPQGLESLSDELRYLYWHGFPLKCLPCYFQPENLVELNMPYSNLELPWEGTKNMKNLKRLDLSHSQNLKDIMDLSFARNLELLNLEGCISLQEIHPSIQNLDKLTILNLRDCKNLMCLLGITSLVSLEDLILSGCSNIKNLIDIPGNIKQLRLDSTSIENLPQCSFHRLETLSLEDCKFLSNLPDWISSLNSLTHLTFSGCSNITELPDNFENLSSLVSLEAERIGISRLPSSISDLRSLKKLSFSGCRGNSSTGLLLPTLCGLQSLTELNLSDCNIVELPDGLLSLSSLDTLDLSGNNFEKIDVSLEPLSNLSELKLNECKLLKSILKLPSNIRRLHTHNCVSLEIVSSSIGRRDDKDIPSDAMFVMNSTCLSFTNCFNLNDVALGNLMNDVEKRLQVDAEESPKLLKPGLYVTYCVELCHPGSEIPGWFTHQNVGSSVTFKLHPQNNSILIGFIICAVVTFDGCCHANDFKLRYNFYLTKSDGSLDDHAPVDLGPWFDGKTDINSDHVLIGYEIRLASFLKQDIYTNSIVVFDTGNVKNYSSWHPFNCCKVKKCGVRPVYLVISGEENKLKVSIR